MNKTMKWMGCLLTLAILMLFYSGVADVWSRNLLILQSLKSILSPTPGFKPISSALKERSPQDCSGLWLSIQFNLAPQDQHKAYQALLVCSDNYIGLVASRRPLDIELANQAINQKPLDTAAWLWLANAQAAARSPDALDSLRRLELLDPNNFNAWCQIGTIYEKNQQIVLARDANLECCGNGAHGPVGCYRAGLMEEKLGNLQKAIENFRLTREEEWLKRADDLEKQLKP